MTEFQRIQTLPTDALAPLLAASISEGFRFVERLVREWEEGKACFDRPGEVLLAAYEGASIVAIGGLTADPYTGDPMLGRLRHLYVGPHARRRGIGRQLMQALEQVAQTAYRAVVLRTDTASGAQFYESLGYAPLPAGGTATHRRELAAHSAERAATHLLKRD